MPAEVFEARFVSSPVGTLGLHVTATAVTRVELNADGPLTPGPAAGLMAELEHQLTAYFAGHLTVFDLPLAFSGTPFQQEVWTALRDIPFGSTCSYADLARRINRPAAIRAVGAANGQNPIPIIVPCHRVIGANGSLTGFGGGLPMKRWLLTHESRQQELWNR